VNGPVKISKDVMDRWQNIVDILAELINIPSALIMRLIEDDIEVFVSSSQSDKNPYHVGDHEQFMDSGLYCETVIRSNDKLLVANAHKDEKWKNNPDIDLGMISYLGFPIVYPDGKPFGTICVLDNKENSYSTTYEHLIMNFREIIQSELALIYMNTRLGEENKDLLHYINELQTLREIIPICMKCKKIRNDDGFWERLETYMHEHTGANFSHGLCPDCYEKEVSQYKQRKLEQSNQASSVNKTRLG